MFDRLCEQVRRCGELAKSNQRRIHRSYKSDGSVLTETDLAVTDMLIPAVRELYPGCNIVTEEIDLHEFDPKAPYTFVIDPIDGTDSYSQGIATWAIAVGILDSNRRPCGAIICAPRFGVGTEELFICSAPGDDRVLINGEAITPFTHNDVPKQMTIGSNLHKYADLSGYKGKIRTFGSSIIQLLAPAIFSNIDCVFNPYCFAWDIAAAHAICLKCGLTVRYFDGSEVEYDDDLLIERKQIRLPILAGSEKCVSWLRENLRLY